ncbi:MAG: hypothetical protein ETSY1_43685 [Candidatus Entotheonella factor]|uniref:Uncharacterized protein n=1 Tax=Entotheonella factor TaxID=1429438 RepID=W4L3F3_ENTF1|nr:hypothetical protein [Candidatus Entotheonella palauensis]ETW92424.1 MAG: hypothetical protein ETSY1_43685 [Candidatus Entotheonella factor]
MYPDFLASPELALECLRQEHHMQRRQAERYRLALYTMDSPPFSFAAWRRAVTALLSRSYRRLKLKPELASMSASSR